MKKSELETERLRLLSLANDLAREHWDVDYTGTLVLRDYEWRHQWAAFAWSNDGIKVEIRMSAPTNVKLGPELTRGNLLHELVHWRLWSQGVPCDDRDETFIAECLRVGAPLSHDRYAQKAYEEYMRKVGAA
ncbi:hypothetical protein PASE110613_09440 [Paenibacillus sediminis]|uniref:SprT-like protein n=1 Tax=Paenibacillus sediminis TaxID=664909 RepID=A0ABS4H6G1_9BACL|nr:hypothetical protein [Paenibacillus sediminis]MBP1938128.1 SprT-like protein [Paenibacillus sediminis]